MRTQLAAVLTVLALGLTLSPLAAHAQDQKVKIQVDVVLVSDKSDTVDPPELAQMKEKFRKQNFSFTSFKRLSLETVELIKDKPTELRLPNGVNATLTLRSLKDSTATVSVVIPRLAAVDVELGNQGAVYQRAGKHVGGELILALSPPAK
ncbi:hypothetical protein [Hyalangium minutum]|uniref:Uncharacterized protein n=1 Tax=Hyalangium minutum TaxID=394096 RepID=A0A085VZF9_9BACT|nr:hypothetical protein [Hyalangium minutum]KFE60822.1 hypothetical protein DB31_4735 [Hyalangium minutum]